MPKKARSDGRGNSMARKVGRPLKSYGKSKLDGSEELIAELLYRDYSKRRLSVIFGVSYDQMRWFISQRGIVAKESRHPLERLFQMRGEKF